LKLKKSGMVLIYKPSGITSFKSLSYIKKALGHGKVGHAGTLDKFAEGLLIVAAGTCTRLISVFESLPKIYEGTICFGKTTSTLDPEGEVVRESCIPSLKMIEEVVPGFIGEIMQVPPLFSAIHVNGQRAYKRALKGEQVELKARKVRIYSIDILDWTKPYLTLKISCSKGTYIRSLARDIGEACGSAAFLSGLKRSSIGEFSSSEAVAPESFDTERDLLSPGQFLKKVSSVRILTVPNDRIAGIRNGVQFTPDWVENDFSESIAALFTKEGFFLALVENCDNTWKYRMVTEGDAG